MNEWWQSLAMRERMLVSLMGAMVVIAMVYWFVLAPLFNSANDYRERVTTAEKSLAWMKRVAPTLPTGNGATARTESQDSLISIVDRTTQQLGLKTRGNQQAGANKLRVQFDNASFDNMVTWFGVLHSTHNVVVDTINVTREDTAGVVSGAVTIQKADN